MHGEGGIALLAGCSSRGGGRARPDRPEGIPPSALSGRLLKRERELGGHGFPAGPSRCRWRARGCSSTPATTSRRSTRGAKNCARLWGRALPRSGGEAQIGRKDPTTVAAGGFGGRGSHIQNPKDDFVGRLRAGAFSARAPARGLRQTESFRLRGPGFWPGEFRGRRRGAAATGRKAGRASHRSRVAAPVHPRSPAATNQAEAATRGPPIQRGRPSAKITQNTWTRAAPRRIASPVSKNFGTGRGGILAASPTQSGKQRGPSPSCEAWARSARRRAAQEKARRASGRTLSQPLSQPRRATSTQPRVCVASEVTSRSMRV